MTSSDSDHVYETSGLRCAAHIWPKVTNSRHILLLTKLTCHHLQMRNLRNKELQREFRPRSIDFAASMACPIITFLCKTWQDRALSHWFHVFYVAREAGQGIMSTCMILITGPGTNWRTAIRMLYRQILYHNLFSNQTIGLSNIQERLGQLIPNVFFY